MTKLNLGCGANTPEGWINVDYALGARLLRHRPWRYINRRVGVFAVDWSHKIHLHDPRKPLPWQDNTVEAVYTPHALEHLGRNEGFQLLTECYRVLEPGGRIRVLVPDLKGYVDRYISGQIKAEHFVDALGVGHARGLGLRRDLFRFFVGFPHRCMYDTDSLIRILSSIGFACAARAGFDSDIFGIEDIEQEQRVQDAAIVEGQK